MYIPFHKINGQDLIPILPPTIQGSRALFLSSYLNMPIWQVYPSQPKQQPLELTAYTLDTQTSQYIPSHGQQSDSIKLNRKKDESDWQVLPIENEAVFNDYQVNTDSKFSDYEVIILLVLGWLLQ